MSFVTLKEAISAMPKSSPCAIGAFNYHNIEYAQAIIDAAEKENTPVVIMLSELMAKYMGIEVMSSVAKILAERAKVPVAVMLDHGKDLELVNKAIDLGISVMYDGSALPFETNIAETIKVVEKAHKAGVSVEGEVGCLGQSEEGDEQYSENLTSVQQAKEFAERTGVDVLAVAVGNSHGFYVGEQRIDIDRISEIKKVVTDIPLVMHGGSDMKCEIVVNAIKAGIMKFNIATDLKYAYAKAMREILSEELHLAPPKIFGYVKDEITKVAREKIRLFSLQTNC